MAVAVMAMPFTEPAIWVGEELFTKSDVAVNEQLVMIFWGMMTNNSSVHSNDWELEFKQNSSEKISRNLSEQKFLKNVINNKHAHSDQWELECMQASSLR